MFKVSDIVINIVGYISTGLMVVQWIPQIYETYKSENDSLSCNMIIISIFCSISWFMYGFFKNDVIIIVANIIMFIFQCCLLLLKYWKKKQNINV